MIQRTTALLKISQMRKPIRIIRGGQGSGKTISILILLINHALSKANKTIIIASEELTKMRLTVILDFIKIMKVAGVYEESRFLAETLYKCPNGSSIKFIGLDKEDVGKGLRPDVVYFNEVNKCGFEAYRQIASRAGIVYADYNPDAEFFIDTDVIPRKDCDFLQLTFEDNELLPERERSEILNYYTQGYNIDDTVKNGYWANLWQVYGLGNIGNLQGVVFDNWKICEVIPDGAKLISDGMDFGFTNDPTAMVGVWLHGGELFVKQFIYEAGLTNQDISAKIKVIGRNESIIADSSEPKSIEEIRRLGHRITGAIKGKDSVKHSINTLQQYKINITADSRDLINEMRAYRWIVDKNGKSTNEPTDFNNHAIDALRYVVLNKLRPASSSRTEFGSA